MRLPAPKNEHQQNRFEGVMARTQARVGDKTALCGEEEAAALALLVQNQMPPQNLRPGVAFDDEAFCAATHLTELSNNTPTLAPVSPFQTPEIQAPTTIFSPTQAQPSRLYAHMALPLNVSEEMRKFEVIDNGGASSLVSHISLGTLPEGGMSVTIGTSVQHADLMDRHLPKLQRRLAAKVATHLRIVESDAPKE